MRTQLTPSSRSVLYSYIESRNREIVDLFYHHKLDTKEVSKITREVYLTQPDSLLQALNKAEGLLHLYITGLSELNVSDAQFFIRYIKYWGERLRRIVRVVCG